MALIFIKDIIEAQIELNKSGAEIAEELGVSAPMVSSYKNHKYNPSITVAKHIYITKGIVLHPYSEESLKYELGELNA